jgi:hypothetical protein
LLATGSPSDANGNALLVDPLIEVGGSEADLASTQTNEGDATFVDESTEVTLRTTEVEAGLDDVEEDGARFNTGCNIQRHVAQLSFGLVVCNTIFLISHWISLLVGLRDIDLGT